MSKENLYIDSNLKFSEVKKGMIFSDGSEVEKKYFYDNDKNYIIFLNQNKEIIYKIRGKSTNSIDKVKKIALVNGELNLITNYFRKDLNLQMAYVYKLAILNDVKSAEASLELLEKEIISRKKILKQFTYLIAPIIISFVLYCLSFGNLFIKNDILKILYDNKVLIIFSGIGSFLSISKNIDKIEFNSSETTRSYFIFAVFKYINSGFCSLMLIILYKSKLINIKFENVDEGLFLGILATLGSFSEGLIPNIFDKLAKKINEDK